MTVQFILIVKFTRAFVAFENIIGGLEFQCYGHNVTIFVMVKKATVE
jgi:hypothetical protein